MEGEIGRFLRPPHPRRRGHRDKVFVSRLRVVEGGCLMAELD
jgi:hypothetical protein